MKEEKMKEKKTIAYILHYFFRRSSLIFVLWQCHTVSTCTHIHSNNHISKTEHLNCPLRLRHILLFRDFEIGMHEFQWNKIEDNTYTLGTRHIRSGNGLLITNEQDAKYSNCRKTTTTNKTKEWKQIVFFLLFH